MVSSGGVVMLGLPGSGKTTFLAALWHQLESGEVPTAFIADRLQPDREHLNKIRDTWLALEEMSRSSLRVEQSALLHVRQQSTSALFDLLIPDIPGESFVRQWIDRRIPHLQAEQLQRAFGVMVFVHCREVESAERLEPRGERAAGVFREMAEWDPKHVPTQVRLVDLLQSAQEVSERDCLRVAVIISAWDEVDEAVTPKGWLAAKMPLVDQFLRANEESMPFAVYGVSAIGGELVDRDALALLPPSLRPRIQVNDAISTDLTLPVQFVVTGGN
jgi:hypothetical protein